MAEEKLNKSGNRRGMSKGSQEVVKKNNFKNKSKEDLSKIRAKAVEAHNAISTSKKTLTELAVEEAEEAVTNKNGETVTVKRAFIKKLKQMGLNGNLNAMLAYFKLLDEMPADKQEIINNTPNIIVQDESVKNKINTLFEDANNNKNI